MNNPASLDLATATALPQSRPQRTQAKKSVLVPLRYRGMIAYRFALALFGGYALASLSAMFIATLFAQDRLNAALSATLTAFVVHCAVFIWVFMVNKTLKASLGVLLPCLVLFGLLQAFAL